MVLTTKGDKRRLGLLTLGCDYKHWYQWCCLSSWIVGFVGDVGGGSKSPTKRTLKNKAFWHSKGAKEMFPHWNTPKKFSNSFFIILECGHLIAQFLQSRISLSFEMYGIENIPQIQERNVLNDMCYMVSVLNYTLSRGKVGVNEKPENYEIFRLTQEIVFYFCFVMLPFQGRFILICIISVYHDCLCLLKLACYKMVWYNFLPD